MNNNSPKNGPKALAEWLDTQKLSNIHQNLENQNKLTKILNNKLPSLLKNNCSVSEYKNNILTLRVTNSSLATQLKYQLPDLLMELRKIADFCGLRTIKIKINPNQAQSKPISQIKSKNQNNPNPTPHREPNSLIYNQLNYIEDAELRAALARLLEHEPKN